MGLFACCTALFKPCQEKTCYFAFAKTKALFSCAVTIALLFAIYIDSTIPLLPKSKISNFNLLLWQYRRVWVGPGRKL